MPRRPATHGPLTALAALTSLLIAVVVASSVAAEDEARLVGAWVTVANAEDVTALAQDGERIWVGSRGGGVAVWSGGTMIRQYLRPQDGLSCNDVNDIVQWRGTWWFATCAGLSVYNAQRDSMESVGADLPSDVVTSLAVDSADRLWVGMAEWWDPSATPPGATLPGGWRAGGLAVTNDGRSWTEGDQPTSWPSRNIADLAEWRGGLWVAAVPHHEWVAPRADGSDTGRFDAVGGGVGRFADGAWTTWTPEQEGAIAYAVTSVAAGSSAVWFGTSGRGMAAYDNSRWTGYRDCADERRCIPDDYVGAVAVGPDGAVWVATEMFNGRGTGLAVLDHRDTPFDKNDDAWRVYRAPDGLPGDLISAILPAANDAGVWLGAAQLGGSELRHGRGLVHLLDDRSTFAVHSGFDLPGGTIPDNVVTAVTWDSAGARLLVGTDGMGLGVWTAADGWTRHTRSSTAGGLASDSIADIAVAADGTLWIATRSFTVDAQGRGWTDGGLSRLRGGVWRAFTTADGLPSNHLSAVAVDGRGKVWVGTGATRFGPKELRFRGAGLAVLDENSGAWERTYTFPTLTSNNVTDLAVHGNEVWAATSYWFYVDPRPGGAQFHTGGGVSVFELDQNRWRTYTEEDGLTPSLEPRGLGSQKPLIDLRSILVAPSGEVWAGGGGFPDGHYTEGRPMDGTLDLVTSSGVQADRFTTSGPISSLDMDASGHVWSVSEGGGLRVNVEGTWLAGDREVGALPSDDLTAVEASGPEPWVGSAGRGLAHLVPPPVVVPTDPAQPTPTQAVVMRLDERIFVPRVLRQRSPVPVRLPRQ